MSGGRGLYTPEILGAAMALVGFPWSDAMPFQGTARSRSCGSTIAMGLALDDEGRISDLGLRPHACAVGQAAAALFAQAAKGCSAADVLVARREIASWLADDCGLPDWPGFDLLGPAKAYPARHGAILLAWDAALDALNQPAT